MKIGRSAWRNWKIQSLIGIAVMLSLLAYAGETAGQEDRGDTKERAEVLFALAEQTLHGEMMYAFVYESVVPLQDEQSAATLEETLRKRLGDTAGDIVVTRKPQAAHLFVRLYDSDAEHLLAQALAWEEWFTALGLPKRDWQIRADGTARASGSVAVANNDMADAAGFSQMIDHYGDEQSQIATFYMEELGRGVSLGDATANLQVAYHRHSETGRWTAALATPMLTGEL